MRETDTLVSTVDEIRPDIGVPHHVRRNRVERGTSTTLSEPFTIRSRETYRFHGSDPLPFHQGSLVDALFTTHVCVCVFVSSIVLFVTYRFSYDRISRMGGRTSAYPVPRKSAPLSSMLFLFRPLSVKETRKPAFVRQTASGMCCFLHAAVYDRFRIISEWRYTVVLEVVNLFRLVDDSKSLLFGIFSRYLCRRCIISCLFVNNLHASSSKRVRTAKFEFLKLKSKTIRLEFRIRRALLYFNMKAKQFHLCQLNFLYPT